MKIYATSMAAAYTKAHRRAVPNRKCQVSTSTFTITKQSTINIHKAVGALDGAGVRVNMAANHRRAIWILSERNSTHPTITSRYVTHRRTNTGTVEVYGSSTRSMYNRTPW